MLEYIPPSLVPYLVLIFNSLVFHILRRIFLRFSPASIQIIFAEIIATLELCSACAELGVVYELHGYLGLGFALQLLCFWFCSVWGDAEACPCGPFEECIFGNGLDGLVMKKLFGQAVGGAITSLWITYIWSLHMTDEHAALHTSAECQAGLQVHMYLGAFIEGLITLISRLVALQSVHWLPEVSILINAVVSTVLVLAATSTTGGFFNPVLATALTLGCKGNTLVEHIVVYWVGSLVGGFIGRYIIHVRNIADDKLKYA
ncbi:hypothetical protein JTE90_001880 [Oedothorax gibbosus]|uniref:Aquaporin n=1 Tax=Oedothorax gibbosus TaxID=931172 RepID=A0AAV6VQL9_9ARAC|nr:hypothetical protein JTE90_001880 [Oedothorax gibbosus]